LPHCPDNCKKQTRNLLEMSRHVLNCHCPFVANFVRQQIVEFEFKDCFNDPAKVTEVK
jgi:hypothetical protein